MKRLDIQITKAALQSFEVNLDGEKPKVSATIALLTEGGKKITDYTITTSSWREEDEFELPVECITPILVLARQLEVVVTQHCRDRQKALNAENETEEDLDLTDDKDEPQEEDKKEASVIVLDHLEDDEIDLDNIPF